MSDMQANNEVMISNASKQNDVTKRLFFIKSHLVIRHFIDHQLENTDLQGQKYL